MYEEEQTLRERVRKFATSRLKPIAREVDNMDDISWEVIELMGDEGLFKYLIPEEYGGVGVKCVNLCIIREELARACVQADDSFAMSGLGSYPVVVFGNSEQKKKYLPSICTGEQIGSYSLTEPEHGSDVAAMEAVAILDGDYYVINGTKCFASNADGAEVCPVFVKTEPEKGSRGISAIIVDVKNRGTGLICNGMKLMAPHPTYELVFHNYRVPKENLLSQPGTGMKIALTTLDMWRVTVGAAATGMACGAYEQALDYARRRVAFNQPLIEFQAIQMKIADMATNIEAARALVLEAARKTDSGDGAEIIKYASMAKLFATEAAQRVVDEALQIYGGHGLIRGTRVEQLFLAVRAPRIYEGTSEIQKLTIARSIRKELGNL